MIFKNRKLENELEKLYINKEYNEIIKRINALYKEDTMPLKFMKRLALAYYYNGEYENSLRFFEKIVVQESNTENLFNVMMVLLPLKKIDQARDVFNEIIKTHRGRKSTGYGKKFLPQLCIPYIRYYYALGLTDVGNYEEAFVQLEELKKIYMQIEITDGTFLYLRGIPFFGETLKLAKRIFEGQNKDFIHSEFLNDLFSSCDEEGKELIKIHYQK